MSVKFLLIGVKYRSTFHSPNKQKNLETFSCNYKVFFSYLCSHYHNYKKAIS